MLIKIITYDDLLAVSRKGLRNGNWRKPNFSDKALFRAALWYLKRGGGIVDGILSGKLSKLIEKLKETKGMRIFRRGFEKAVELLREGVFAWAPRLKDWLKDPGYIFWLGMMR